MRNVLLLSLLIFNCTLSWAQSAVPDVTKINLAWIDGIYTNPEELPWWGFFIDTQEETLFGAVFGYNGNDSSFITLQGSVYSADPLVYRGDVFFITNGGTVANDVGNFTWQVEAFEASPSARLTVSSNILNVSNLLLTRMSYVEQDKIDILTGADWNIMTRVVGISFGQHFGIYDDRIESDGLLGVPVIDNADPDLVGAAVYVPPGDGDAYGLMIPFSGETNLFAVFNASDTEMFGRYWLLEPDETPSGNGNYFHGSADTIQASNQNLFGGATQSTTTQTSSSIDNRDESRQRQLSMYSMSAMEAEAMFPDWTVQNVYVALNRFRNTPSKQAAE